MTEPIVAGVVVGVGDGVVVGAADGLVAFDAGAERVQSATTKPATTSSTAARSVPATELGEPHRCATCLDRVDIRSGAVSRSSARSVSSPACHDAFLLFAAAVTGSACDVGVSDAVELAWPARRLTSRSARHHSSRQARGSTQQAMRNCSVVSQVGNRLPRVASCSVACEMQPDVCDI